MRKRNNLSKPPIVKAKTCRPRAGSKKDPDLSIKQPVKTYSKKKIEILMLEHSALFAECNQEAICSVQDNSPHASEIETQSSEALFEGLALYDCFDSQENMIKINGSPDSVTVRDNNITQLANPQNNSKTGKKDYQRTRKNLKRQASSLHSRSDASDNSSLDSGKCSTVALLEKEQSVVIPKERATFLELVDKFSMKPNSVQAKCSKPGLKNSANLQLALKNSEVETRKTKRTNSRSLLEDSPRPDSPIRRNKRKKVAKLVYTSDSNSVESDQVCKNELLKHNSSGKKICKRNQHATERHDSSPGMSAENSAQESGSESSLANLSSNSKVIIPENNAQCRHIADTVDSSHVCPSQNLMKIPILMHTCCLNTVKNSSTNPYAQGFGDSLNSLSALNPDLNLNLAEWNSDVMVETKHVCPSYSIIKVPVLIHQCCVKFESDLKLGSEVIDSFPAINGNAPTFLNPAASQSFNSRTIIKKEIQNAASISIVKEESDSEVEIELDAPPLDKMTPNDFLRKASRQVESVEKRSVEEIRATYDTANKAISKTEAETVKEFFANPNYRKLLRETSILLGNNVSSTCKAGLKSFEFPKDFEEENFMDLLRDYITFILDALFGCSPPDTDIITGSSVIAFAVENLSPHEFNLFFEYFFTAEDLTVKGVRVRLIPIAILYIFEMYQSKTEGRKA